MPCWSAPMDSRLRDTPVSPRNSLQSAPISSGEKSLQSAPISSGENSLQSAPEERQKLCQKCHGQPRVPNRSRCASCLARGQERYWQAVKAGLCTLCYKHAAEPGRRRCLSCAETIRQDSARRYSQTKHQGLCTYCRHHKTLPHRELCFDCWKKKGRLDHARRQRTQRQWLHWVLVVGVWRTQHRATAQTAAS